ncbi:MAG: hypothetical protein LBG42_03975 [Treponema sp.]|nr:hypothetical protein [Treponema sp.]
MFYDEFTRFKWQLAAFVKDKTEVEKARITGLESVSFFHKKRELLLALPLGDSFVSLLTDRTANNCGDVITSFFNYLGIAGIQFTDSGETRFLIFNAGKSVTITAIRREKKIYRQGENLE